MTAKKTQPIPANIIAAAQAVRDAQEALSALRIMPIARDARGEISVANSNEIHHAIVAVRENRDTLTRMLVDAILG